MFSLHFKLLQKLNEASENSLVPRPEGGRLPLLVHALNHSGIPLALQTIDLRLYIRDVKTDTHYTDTLHGLYTCPCIIVANIVCITRDLDHALSNALQWLGTPKMILKLEQ